MTSANRRLTLLITSLSWGGAQVQLVLLAGELRRRGWEVDVISMLEPELFVEELERIGIRVTSLHMQRGVPELWALFRAAAILRDWDPTVLCSFMYHANVLGRLAGRIAGVPVIVSSIRNENMGGRVRDQIVRLTNWASHAVTTNSRLAAAELSARRVVANDRLRVIPNAIVVEDFKSATGRRETLRRELGVSEGDFLWLAVGRLDDQKDYPTLLAAFQRLAEARPQAKLRIAGDGPLRGELGARVRELGLEHCVAFLGPRLDCRELYGAADGLVLSSAFEGMPNVVMEALAAGTPVVATRVGGVAELVDDGISGYLVPPRDPVALSGGLERLMDVPAEERQRMGMLGCIHMEENYGVESITSMWESLYADLFARLRQEAV